MTKNMFLCVNKIYLMTQGDREKACREDGSDPDGEQAEEQRVPSRVDQGGW